LLFNDLFTTVLGSLKASKLFIHREFLTMTKNLIAVLALCLPLTVFSQTLTIDMHSITADSDGGSIGTITFTDTDHGLLILTDLNNLPTSDEEVPGRLGFHIHQNADCGNNGMAAGGHLDPEQTNSHEGPMGDGHLGDLRTLIVLPDGSANEAQINSRLTVDDVIGRSIMIHEGGDNYSDDPAPLGGGGPRYACGVIEMPGLVEVEEELL
jgi:superoxide dismutase, Cu-Zn family